MEYLVVIFIFGLIALGIFLLYPLSRNRSAALNYFFLNIMPIIIACCGTLIAVYFTEKSASKSIQDIQNALYPNDFLVGLYLPEQHIATEFCEPSLRKINKVIVDKNKMGICIRVANRSKYPAVSLPIAIYISDGNFMQNPRDVLMQFRKRLIYGYSVRRSSEAIFESYVNSEKVDVKLNGCMLILDYLQGKPADGHLDFDYHCFDPFDLELKSDYGYLAVTVRNLPFLFGFVNRSDAEDYQFVESLPVDETNLSGPNGTPWR